MKTKTAKTYTVYRHYNSENTLLYVGLTTNLRRRNYHHKATTPWFHQVTRIETQNYPDEASGLAAELATIRKLRPLHNTNNGRNAKRNAREQKQKCNATPERRALKRAKKTLAAKRRRQALKERQNEMQTHNLPSSTS